MENSTNNEPDEVLPRATRLIRDGIAAGLQIGAQLYVSRAGKPVLDVGLGEARPGLPMGPEVILPWLSSVKPVMAVAVAQQCEVGRLDLDDPVCRFIPEFACGGKESVTIRHLLTHTGGFRSADRIPSNLDWQETIRRICQTALEADWVPGKMAGYQYLSSWFVLGEVLCRIDGRPFERYARERIFEPVGMLDSWLGMTPNQCHAYGDRLGMLFHSGKARMRPHPWWNGERGCVVCRPGGSGRGPVRELGRFYETILEGLQSARSGPGALPAARVAAWGLRPETIRHLTRRHRVGLFDQTFRHVLDCGLGFYVNSNRYGAETIPYGFGRYCSDATFGHSGSQSSTAFLDPEVGLVVAWVLNGMPGEAAHQRRARELNSSIYEDLGLKPSWMR